MAKLFLLDALALIFRAYFALANSSPRQTSYGYDTNAQFGFTNTLIDLLLKEKPSHIAVCFDTQAPTQRHKEYELYKAQRQEAPEALIQAIPDIKEIITAFNIPIIESEGFEADDIIGTLALQAANQGFEVYMVTPDKDYGQLLIQNNIYIYKPSSKGASPEILTAKEVCQKWDIQNINQVIDVLGLMGDAVDNIPGIKGIGEKTAAKLLKEYNTLENVLANVDNIKGALGEKIKLGKELAILSKKLATIITDAPVNFSPSQFEFSGFETEKLKPIFQKLEFKTLGKRIFETPDNQINTLLKTQQPASLFDFANEVEKLNNFKHIGNTQHEYFIVNTKEELEKLLDNLIQYSEICLDTETTDIHPKLAKLIGLSFAVKSGQAYYLPLLHSEKETKEILEYLNPLWNRPDLMWVGQNLKYDLLILKNYNIELKGNYFDTMIAHYVIKPEAKHNMDQMSEELLNYSPISIETLIGKKGKNQGNLKDVKLEKVAEYSAEDADITLQLKNILAPKLPLNEVDNIFYEIDNPLVKVLVDMEDAGIKIDTEFLKSYAKDIEKLALSIEEAVIKKSGIKFNLSSPKQVGEVLFKHLGIDNGNKKTKTGQLATGEEVLIKLAKQHTIVQEILDYRELTKLLSTYIIALPQLVNLETGRVHTSYSQTVAVTGRLSSNFPNLQNIPIRTIRGQEIRKAFIARNENWVIMSADYSQIELRIIAALSADKNMIEAFCQDKDIHIATAAKVFNIPEEDVSKEQRYKAKSVNFGLVYGQGVFGLAENLAISRSEAQEIISTYKNQFSGIQNYMQKTIAYARENGFVKTLMGRKRYLPEINSQNFTIRSFAERNAINSPIQGTAADMIKLAMITIHQRLKTEKLQTLMLLQVHDELVFEVPLTEVEYVKKIILESMENALPLPNGVPIKAGLGVGQNWLEAH